MTIYRAFIFLITAQFLVACGSGNEITSETATEVAPVDDSAETLASASASDPAPTTTSAATQGKVSPTGPSSKSGSKEPGPGPMPPKFAEIQIILKAASLTSEPRNLAYNAHSDPTVALRWFSRYGTTDHERVFALRALGLYPTPQNAVILSEVAMNESEPAAVRAGAVRGLGRYDLESVDYEKIKAFIYATVSGKDIALASAAADAMHGMPTAHQILLDLVEGAETPAQLKAAAKRALGPQVE